MSASSDFPSVEVSVVLLEREGMILAEFNPKWEMFTLPTARLRRRLAPGTPVREAPLDAAVRAAAKALGRPLGVRQLPQPVALDVPAQALLRSGRDQQTKRYVYHVFGQRVAYTAPRHALGWHTLWMRREDFFTHRPISPTAVHVMKHLPDGVPFAI
jgi:hypothetical protein